MAPVRALVKAEVAAQLARGLPVSCSSLARASLDVISIARIGALGSAADMAAAALANSVVRVFALSVFVGLSSATVTLASQAKGAGDNTQAALWLHRAFVVNASFALPMTCLLLLLEPALEFIGEDAQIASRAGDYCKWLLPSMWAFGAQYALSPWLQCFGVVRLPMCASFLMVPVHVALLQLLVSSAGFGVLGAAMASSASALIAFATIVTLTYALQRHRIPLRTPSHSSLLRLPTFLKLGLPGVLMLGEWWASELGILLSGLLPAAATNLASMSVYQGINSVCFMWPLGASVAGATRVGSCLGAGDAIAAKRAATVCVSLAFGYGMLASLALLMLRETVARAFTSDEEVVAAIGHLLPNLVIYVIADSCQVACGAVLQGCGRQRHGGPLVICSYYLVGLPTGALLAFQFEWGARGIVTGLLAGKMCHFGALAVLVLTTDWRHQVNDAAKRVAGEQELKMKPTSEESCAATLAMVAAVEDSPADSTIGIAEPPQCSAESAAVHVGGGAAKIKESDTKGGRGAASTRYTQFDIEPSTCT